MSSRTLIGLFTCTALACSALSCSSQKLAGDDKAFARSAPTIKGNEDMPIPPRDAQYTIYCQQFNSPNHMSEARQAKLVLSESTPMKKWYVVHGNEQSTLYYGFYRTFNSGDTQDADEAKRALADLNAIRAIQDSQGGRPFSTCLPVPIDAPDPEANPAWDLTRTNGQWSVEIAAYNAPGRKEAAVESVREARKQGIEAYYYHGPTASSVCIGSWPLEAAHEFTTEQQNVSPDVPLLVTPQPLSEEYKKELGGGVQTIAPQVEILDPTLRDTLEKWKEHDVNGSAMMKTIIDPVTKRETQVLDRPVLIQIPHPDGAPAMPETGVPTPEDNVTNPPAPSRGIGQLRSLGDR